MAGDHRPDAAKLVDHPPLLLGVDLSKSITAWRTRRPTAGASCSSSWSAAAGSRLATRIAALRIPVRTLLVAAVMFNLSVRSNCEGRWRRRPGRPRLIPKAPRGTVGVAALVGNAVRAGAAPAAGLGPWAISLCGSAAAEEVAGRLGRRPRAGHRPQHQQTNQRQRDCPNIPTTAAPICPALGRAGGGRFNDSGMSWKVVTVTIPWHWPPVDRWQQLGHVPLNLRRLSRRI